MNPNWLTILELMKDGVYRSIPEIAKLTKIRDTTVGCTLRTLRMGGLTVDRTRVNGTYVFSISGPIAAYIKKHYQPAPLSNWGS